MVWPVQRMVPWPWYGPSSALPHPTWPPALPAAHHHHCHQALAGLRYICKHTELAEITLDCSCHDSCSRLNQSILFSFVEQISFSFCDHFFICPWDSGDGDGATPFGPQCKTGIFDHFDRFLSISFLSISAAELVHVLLWQRCWIDWAQLSCERQSFWSQSDFPTIPPVFLGIKFYIFGVG